MTRLIIVTLTLLLTACATAPDASDRTDGAYRLDINLTGSLQNPAFSPDGTMIVFTRFHGGYNRGASDLFLYDLTTGNLRPLVSEGSSNVNLPGASWGVSGITFSSDRGHHDEIYIISADGLPGEERQITSRPNLQSYEPSFSPDGEWLVFETHAIDADDGAITMYNLTSGQYVALTAVGSAKQPNWSPAGGIILYQEGPDNWIIWGERIGGGRRIRYTGLDESATDAAFSADGRWVVYSSENENTVLANIYKTPSTGGDGVRITNYVGYDGAPSISPDGKWVVFESVNGDPDGSSGTTLWIIEVP